MDAGRLDRRIVLKRRKAGTNAFGEPVDEWTTLATVWSNVAPVSDGERWRAGETLASKMCRFTIRYSLSVAILDPRDQIEYDGRVWDIQGVKEINRREFLELTAAARGEQT
jgi:SPP1 family predicted phage head-tail adaptor